MHVERTWQGRHLTPFATEQVLYQDSLYFIVSIASRVWKKRLTVKQRKKLKLVACAIERRFGVRMDLAKSGQHIQFFARVSFWAFKTMLGVRRPRVVFLVASNVHGSLIEAARSLKIPAAEIQHAVISQSYVVLSYEKPRIKATAPDCLLTFGEAWSNAASIPIQKDNIIAVGYPYLSEFTKNREDDTKDDTIVFLSQKGLASDLIQLAIECKDKHSGALHAVFKLHPEEVDGWTRSYPKLFDACEQGLIDVIDGDSPSLYQLLAKSKWQVGVFSTALLEGMVLGCATFIVDLPGAEVMNSFVDGGMAKLIGDVHDIDLSFELECDVSKNFANDWQTRFKNAVNLIETANRNS